MSTMTAAATLFRTNSDQGRVEQIAPLFGWTVVERISCIHTGTIYSSSPRFDYWHGAFDSEDGTYVGGLGPDWKPDPITGAQLFEWREHHGVHRYLAWDLCGGKPLLGDDTWLIHYTRSGSPREWNQQHLFVAFDSQSEDVEYWAVGDESEIGCEGRDNPTLPLRSSRSRARWMGTEAKGFDRLWVLGSLLDEITDN